jgi:hypothetical protein
MSPWHRWNRFTRKEGGWLVLCTPRFSRSKYLDITRRSGGWRSIKVSEKRLDNGRDLLSVLCCPSHDEHCFLGHLMGLIDAVGTPCKKIESIMLRLCILLWVTPRHSYRGSLHIAYASSRHPNGWRLLITGIMLWGYNNRYILQRMIDVASRDALYFISTLALPASRSS